MESRCQSIFLFCVLMAGTGHVAAQSFLQLQGITGSATDTNHVGWMNLESATLAGVAITVSATSRTPSAPSFGNLCFSKPLDSASPTLALNCAEGTLISSGTVDLTLSSSSAARYFRLNLTNIFITSVSQSGRGSVDESVCLSPQVMSWNYTYYLPGSGLPGSYVGSQWDAINNRGSRSSTAPAFVVTGIRNSSGVQLSWNATAGKIYRIFAVTALNQPFAAVALVPASSSGNLTYTFVPTAPAMFYTVEALPDGY